ncbi:MAG: TIGR00296 family protein [Candidatus Micrarchaeia archaeon]
MKVYKLSEGEKLVKSARNAIELYLRSPKFDRSIIEKSLAEFNDNVGVFVTIEHYPTMSLRGCIGFPRAVGPIKKTLVEAAIAAATEDPRFIPLSHVELDDIIIEVSILTEPVLIGGTPSEIKRQIKIGKDGLIIEYGYESGLLLPIVAVEQKWNEEEFLNNVCIKAGLREDTWKHGNATLYKFSTQVFREESPNGKVIEVKLEQ